jgi:nucleotide-binding universal stress UspA family protein
MLAIRTILFPTDFSKRAEYGFHLACALARDYGARLLIAHVKTPPVILYGEMGSLPPEPLDLEESLRAQLLEVRPADEQIACEHFYMVGEPAEEIVRLANEEHVDLIVMGTHGRRGLGRLVMGSVAEQVVRTAACPVVTVKAPIAVAEPAEEHAAPAVG